MDFSVNRGKRHFFLFFLSLNLVGFFALGRLIAAPSVDASIANYAKKNVKLDCDIIKPCHVCPVGEPTETTTTYQIVQSPSSSQSLQRFSFCSALNFSNDIIFQIK